MLILHGDNQILSRQFFVTLRSDAVKQGLQLLELPANTLTLSDLSLALETSSLFGPSNFVCLENFFSRRAGHAKTEIVDYLKAKNPPSLAIWENKDVSLQLKSFPVSSIRKFDLPKYVFRFLEDWSLDNYRFAVSSTPPELIFSLLVRHLRQLIMVADGITSFPSWQLPKLKAQSHRFSLSRLLSMYHDLLNLDYSQKTSSSPFDLASSLEVWLVKALR